MDAPKVVNIGLAQLGMIAMVELEGAGCSVEQQEYAVCGSGAPNDGFSGGAV